MDTNPNTEAEILNDINIAYQGSMQQVLRDNIGQYVDIEFLIGSGATTTRSGILNNVGVSYVVLYDRKNERYTICDLYSIKFVTIYDPNRRPAQQYGR